MPPSRLEQVPADGLGVRPRVVLAVEVLPVVAAGRLVPLLLDVGDRPQLVGLGDVAPNLGVVAKCGCTLVSIIDVVHVVHLPVG